MRAAGRTGITTPAGEGAKAVMRIRICDIHTHLGHPITRPLWGTMIKATKRVVLSRIRAVNPAGRPVAGARISARRVRRSALRILSENVLCSIATVGQAHRAHINTAYFAYSDRFELVFLAHPEAGHCRNLSRDGSAAVAVFASRQKWTGPDRGVQLFGQCRQVTGRHAQVAERLYAQRFRAYARWKTALRAESVGTEYRFYRFVASALKILDERQFGDGVFIKVIFGRPSRAA